MELSRNDSKMMQGLSVLAMVSLHLFDRWEYDQLYSPILYFGNLPFVIYIGQLSDFCVMGFAFCSGYAHMIMVEQKNYYKRRLESLWYVLCNYWVILILFSFISIICGRGSWMPGNLKTFVGNALLYDISYNGSWWYMYTYVILVLISPLILKIVKHFNPILVLIVGFSIYCIAYYMRFETTINNLLLSKFGPFGMTLFEYLIGCIWCDKKLFTKVYSIWDRLSFVVQLCVSMILVIGILLGHTLLIPSLFVAPINGIIIMTLFHFWRKPTWVERIFLVIGRHSNNIWLTHMFFYLVLFENFVFIAKYPILIYILMLTITMSLSIVLQVLKKILTEKLSWLVGEIIK